jgi:hypothetical protein
MTHDPRALQAGAGKKDAKDGKGGKGGSGSGAGAEPPNFADMAVCNAAGALQHLTFLDAAKQQVGVRRVQEGEL